MRKNETMQAPTIVLRLKRPIGRIAFGPLLHSHATKTITRTPKTQSSAMTDLSLQGLLIPPSCKGRIKQVVTPWIEREP